MIRRLLVAVGCLIGLAMIPIGAHADTLALSWMQPVSGRLDANAASWKFDAQEGQVLGIRAEGTSGDLNPQLELFDPLGKSVAKVSFPGRVASVEAFRAPTSGAYTLNVSRLGETSGDYTLVLMPGFSTLTLSDPMTGDNLWRTWKQDQLTAQLDAGKLRLQFRGDNRFAWTTAEQFGALGDVYMQADAQFERQSTPSAGGLMVRVRQEVGGPAFYAYQVNSEGKYRFVLSSPDKLIVLRDWTPLDKPGAASAALGILAQGNRFTLFHDGHPLETIEDSQLTGSGRVGLIAGTQAGQNSTASVLYDNVVLTTPATATPTFLPAMLKNWERAPSLIIQELQDAQGIPANAKQVFSAQEAFQTNYTEGLAMQRLAKPLTFTDSLTIADVSWDSSSSDIACGIALRYVDDANFSMAYVDRFGGYGLNQTKAGTPFASRYELSESIKTPNEAVNRLIVVGVGPDLALYINGRLAGNLQGSAETGAIGAIAYNFVPVSTRCQFNNVTIFSLDAP